MIEAAPDEMVVVIHQISVGHAAAAAVVMGPGLSNTHVAWSPGSRGAAGGGRLLMNAAPWPLPGAPRRTWFLRDQPKRSRSLGRMSRP